MSVVLDRFEKQNEKRLSTLKVYAEVLSNSLTRCRAI